MWKLCLRKSSFEDKSPEKLSLSWWAGAVFTAALGAATALGNGSVLFALARIRRAPTHYPLASLATADFLIGVFVIPIAAARELFVFHLNWAICACWSALDVLCCTASILSLCALGWERWFGITAPLARAQRAKRARRYAALVWPAAILVAIPTVIVPSPKHNAPEEVAKACTVNTNFGYVIFSTILSFYLPAAVMMFFYAMIVHSLARSPQIRAHRGNTARSNGVVNEKNTAGSHVRNANQTNDVRNNNSTKVTVLTPNRKHLNAPNTSNNNNVPPVKSSSAPGYIHSRQRRATRTIVMLMSLFLFCWTPFFIMLTIDSTCECVFEIVWQWCTWLGYMNSALNPIVYAASSPTVWKALQDSFGSFTCTSTKTNEFPLSPRRPT